MRKSRAFGVVLLLALLLGMPALNAATTSLAPVPVLQFLDANGAPLSGALLFTYAAGTTTKLATYTDSTGGTPNTNPVVLDSRGSAPVWLTTGSSYKFVLAPKGSSDPPTNPIFTVDNINPLGVSNVVIGPSSSTTGDIAVFSDTSGKNIADGGPPGGTPLANTLPTVSLPNDATSVSVANTGLGNYSQQLALQDLLQTTDGRNLFSYDESVCTSTAACEVPAENANAITLGTGNGSAYLNIQNLSFDKPYIFVTSGITTAYLDPGRNSVFSTYNSSTGQMLKLDPGSTAVVYRWSEFIYAVVPANTAPEGSLTRVDVTSTGTYDLPAHAGSGKLYLNSSGGAVNFTIGNTDFDVEYCVANDSASMATITPPSGDSILPYATNGAVPVPSGGLTCLDRYTTGIWILTRHVNAPTDVSNNVAQGAAQTLTTATPLNVTSISLVAGRYNISGNVCNHPTAGTTTTALQAGISLVTAAIPTPPNTNGYSSSYASVSGALDQCLTVGPYPLSLSSTTTVYLTAESTFSGGTGSAAYGYIRAQAVW